jgi:hypothetical protein
MVVFENDLMVFGVCGHGVARGLCSNCRRAEQPHWGCEGKVESHLLIPP